MTVFKIMKTVLLILMICLQVQVQCVLCNLPVTNKLVLSIKKKILLYIEYIFRNVLEKFEC